MYDAWQASEWKRCRRRAQGDASAFEPDLKPLGSGADFVPFQDHLGVPTMAIEFIGDNGYGYGTYHTNYDSRAYVEKIADPGFAQGVLMSQRARHDGAAHERRPTCCRSASRITARSSGRDRRRARAGRRRPA